MKPQLLRGATFKHLPLFLDCGELAVDNNGISRRYVTPSGVKYPSITTVLGSFSKEAIVAWRERVGAEAANKVSHHAVVRGSALHTLAENYLNNVEEYMPPGTMPHVSSMFTPVRKVLDRAVDEVYMQEVALYSDHLRVAGRVDLVGRFRGKKCIIDFKTSNRVKKREDIADYFIQATAYAIMVEERTGVSIPGIVIVMAVDNSDECLVFEEKRDQWVPALLQKMKDFEERVRDGQVRLE